MLKRRVYLILLFMGVVLAGVLVAVLSREREPEYGGKKLSEWVEMTHYEFSSLRGSHPQNAPNQAVEAIGHIGTNATPYLLKWIRYEPAESKTKRIGRINAYLTRMNPRWYIIDSEFIRAEGAAAALSRLGPQAHQYIPELARLLNETNAWYSSKNAVEALVGFGEAGVPPLVACLSNGPMKWRDLIVIRLGQMGANAVAARPALQQLLNDGDRNMRSRATNALRKIDPEALKRMDQAK